MNIQKRILELLNEETSVYQISDITDIPASSVYRMIRTLLDLNIIISCGYQLATKDSTKAEQLFKLKKKRAKN